MSNCLAIEASGEVLSLAACAGDRRASRALAPAKRESARLYVHVTELLAEIGISVRDLRCIAFGCGPGSFTGVRLAATAAQSLAWACGAQVARRSSLAVLAAGVFRRHDVPRVALCVDARMGRAYFGVYRRTADGEVLAEQPDQLVVPGEFVATLQAGAPPCDAAGNGWAAFPVLRDLPAFRPIAGEEAPLPAATDLLSMALRDEAAGRLLPPELALPEYLAHGPVVAAHPPRDAVD
jgi:tRNA threonylcarbamoyladenosine biosynthesis protein TsaB